MLFSGVHVPCKAFGEFVEHDSRTPSISAVELDAMMQNGTDLKVLDSRPFDEYTRISIPTGINVPGAELVLRVREIVPSPSTTIVVNCAGRTRSIIGAQSLINAGIPNKVVALRNGTMGWHLAGFTCESRKSDRAPNFSDSGLAWAKSAAQLVAGRVIAFLQALPITKGVLIAAHRCPARRKGLCDLQSGIRRRAHRSSALLALP